MSRSSEKRPSSSGHMPGSSGGMLSSSGQMPGSSGGTPSSSGQMPVLGNKCECLSLSQAISEDRLHEVKKFFNGRQLATTTWIDAFETPLKNACSCCQLEIVKKLLLHEITRPAQMAVETEEDTNYRLSLALDIAAGDGNLKTVTNLCEAYPKLLDQKNAGRYGLAIPVVRASNAGHKEVTGYLYKLYRETHADVLMDTDRYWATCLLLDAIFYRFLDIALDIFDLVQEDQAQSLALTKQPIQRSAPLRFLALKPDLFRSHCDLGFWASLIYSCLFWKTLQGFPKWFGIKKIYELRDRHRKALRLLQKMCTTELPAIMLMDEKWKETVYEALLEAVENGNKEFFIEMIKCNHQLLWISETTSGRNLFQLAVEFKKEKIFNLIHGLDDIKVTLLRSSDKENNNILHIAAHLSTPDQLSKISGPALKIQSETQWYEEVESLVSEREVMQKNNDNKTPRQVFEDSHEPLRKEGEEWMKYTATACSFVAALIATVTFQAIFTVPGGTDESSGKPILLKDLHFTAFIISDTLAFFASCTSVLIFLSILTSRYSFNDFIVSLPRKMILGLSILFISIASMLVGFITALSASMRSQGDDFFHLWQTTLPPRYKKLAKIWTKSERRCRLGDDMFASQRRLLCYLSQVCVWSCGQQKAKV